MENINFLGKQRKKMDVDIWASRVHSLKHVSAVQAARLNNSDNHLIMDGTEGDDDMRAWFPCPFCYTDIEVLALCSHLQEEHCFGLTNAVCPICAANLGKDAIEHFTVQHAHSVKRRRKSQKSGFLNNSSTMHGKDMRELSSFFGSNLMNDDSGNVRETAPDPLLFPFLCNVPNSDPKDILKDELSSNAASTASDLKSTKTKTSISDEVQEEEYEERRQRAVFLQQLILSTIF